MYNVFFHLCHSEINNLIQRVNDDGKFVVVNI